jgi:hypothetical protein
LAHGGEEVAVFFRRSEIFLHAMTTRCIATFWRDRHTSVKFCGNRERPPHLLPTETSISAEIKPPAADTAARPAIRSAPPLPAANSPPPDEPLQPA